MKRQKDSKLNDIDIKYECKGETFFEMIDCLTTENVHSNFLCWVFNHDDWAISLGQHVVLDLLKCINTRAMHKKADGSLPDMAFPKELTDALKASDVKFEYMKDKNYHGKDRAIREYPLKGFKVRTEKGYTSGFVDIHILGRISYGETTFPVRIIIENKIDSKEGESQTHKYFAYFTEKCGYGGYDYLKAMNIDYFKTTNNGKRKHDDFIKSRPQNEVQVFVYLTCHSDDQMEEPVCECKYFIHINYHDILKYVLRPLLASESVSDRHKMFLKEYIVSIEHLYHNEESKDEELDEKDLMQLDGSKRGLESERYKKNLALLKGCGMKAFVDYLFPALSENLDVNVSELSSIYPDFGRCATGSRNTMLSKAKKIFQEGWEYDALEIIACCRDEKTRLKAEELLRE